MKTHPERSVRDDWVVLALLGTLVAMVGSVAHEIIGHGLGCAAEGGRITLVTFLVFRCDGAGWLADGGGPIGALAVGCLALLATRRGWGRGALSSLALFTVASVLLFWFFAQMVREAFDGSDDWGHVARDLQWPPEWHIVAAIVGVVGYACTLRLLRRSIASVINGRRMRLIVPYIGAALSALLLGALWHGGAIDSAVDGLLTFGVAPFGHLLMLSSADERKPSSEPIPRSRVFISVALMVIVVVATCVAPGIGRLA